MNYSNIIIIGSININKRILKESSVLLIHEDNLVPKKKINEFLGKMKSISTNKDGWLEQQFLKMAYSRICQKEYYLVWDLDTIPIKPIKMFENGHPIFDMKIEHNIPYFNTIEKLIPGLKFANRSYISEHMIIKTELMKNLLDIIEKNSKLPGIFFWEKVLMAIDIKFINFSGFSEFETYGSFVDTKYPNIYRHRNFFSKRDMTTYFGGSENLSKKDINWLSKDFYALSFENWHKFKIENLELVKDSKLQNLYNPNAFFANYNNISLNFQKSNKTNNNG